MNNEKIDKIKFFDEDKNQTVFKIDVDDFSTNSYYLQNPQMFVSLCNAIQLKKAYAVSRYLCLTKNKQIYDWICEVTLKMQNGKLIERLFWIFNDIHEYPKCMHPDCHNSMNSSHFNNIKSGYKLYCSFKCRCSSPISINRRTMTNNAKSYEQKQKEVEKRLATYNKHKAEDPGFMKRIQEKSIATRKKNHGEDYTGRKKCWKTIEDRYGVSNPMNIKEVQEHIKQHNLETYGVEWHIAAPEIREKSRQTCQENYGVDNPFAADEIIHQIRQHNLDNYGVEHNWQREDVKQHIRDTNKRLYGYENAMQNSEIRSKMMSNIKYDGKSFDSYPEVCFYIWLKDGNIPFDFQPKMSFEYVFDGKLHTYCPDFKVSDMLFEIKGDHFFKDGKMICPFRYDDWDDARYEHECQLYEAKHQCMLQNDVVIMRSDDYAMFIEYVESKMGKDFYKALKDTKKQI